MNSHRYAHVAALLDTVAAVFESHIATTLWRKIHPDKSQTTVKISTVNENINVLFWGTVTNSFTHLLELYSQMLSMCKATEVFPCFNWLNQVKIFTCYFISFWLANTYVKSHIVDRLNRTTEKNQSNIQEFIYERTLLWLLSIKKFLYAILGPILNYIVNSLA